MLSLLLPTYEPKPEHLRAALDSLLAQTYTDWTLLIHDDASKTDVKAMIEPYLTDPRITFARSEERLGIAENWNACLVYTQGNAGKNARSRPQEEATTLGAGVRPADEHHYIQFLFQDDLWEPHYLERGVNAMEEHPNVGLVATHHRYLLERDAAARSSNLQQQAPAIYEEVVQARRAILPGVHSGLQFLHEWSKNGLRPNIVGEPSFVLLRKAVTDRIGLFNGNMTQGLDMEYWLRILAVSDMVWIAEEGGDFRVHAQAASSVNEQSGSGLTDRLQCYETLLKVLPNERQRFRRDMQMALTGMILKFAARTSTGGKSGMKKGWILGFALRHPMLSLGAFRDAKRQQKEQRKPGRLGR